VTVTALEMLMGLRFGNSATGRKDSGDFRLNFGMKVFAE